MSTVKSGQSVAATGMSSWWKHLRKVGKRMFWKRHRRTDKRDLSR